MLRYFGVAERTAAVYAVMLALPGADVAAIADSLSITTDDVRQELDALADLLLVSMSAGDRPVTVPPHEAFDVLIAREQARLEARRRDLESSRTNLAGVVESFLEGRVVRDDFGLIERIDEGKVVRSRLYQLLGDARSSVASIEPGEPIPADALPAATRLDDHLLDRRITVRAVVSAVSVRTDYWREHLQRQDAKGALTRVHPAPPMRLIIIDDEIAVIPNSATRSGAWVLHSADLVRPALTLFEQVWASAAALDHVERSDDVVSEARMRHVAVLMAAGLKDETIARRLDVSIRTVRRLVSATMAALQSESRFQAGVTAVKRGWVD